MTPIKNELIGAGLCLVLAIYGFYAIDPLARRVILVEKLLKIWCYCLVLLSFNLWMRVDHRLKMKDPDSEACMKENIKMTSFFCAMFALMELPLFLSTI